ncbi:S1 RNA-binding domain-containing protein, partial [Chloroflexota bacterium]
MEEKQITEIESQEGVEGGQEISDDPMNALLEEKQITETESQEGEEGGQEADDHPMNALPEEKQIAETQPQGGDAGGQEIDDVPTDALLEEKHTTETESLEGDAGGQEAEDHPMNALLEEALNFEAPKRGQIVDGVIVSVSPTEILVDVNAKSEGVVPSKELEGLGREGLESLQVGTELSVYVVRSEDRDGNLILSIRRAVEEGDWKQANALHESGEVTERQVAGFNKGGLIVRLGKLRGFVPASQLSPKNQGSNKQQPEERWSRLV